MTSFNVDEARKKILELTQNDSNISNRNVFKETLRQLKSIFGSLYYTDGNNNKIKINCTTGKQERAVAKLIQENNLVLPLITITENGISEDNSRLRNTNLLVHEVVWDPEEKRAKRTLSLPPRPINLSFTINIWTKYMEDMDMIRSNILSMFNPYLSIDTKFSDFTIAYMREEADIIDPTAADNTDRLVQKTITLTVQTYVPSPKFLYTNTGEIKAFKADVTIDSTTETLSLINPPASIPDEEYSSSGGPFNTGLTLSGSLDDVEIVEVNIGQVLAWNGSYWIPSSVAGGGGGAGTFDHQELNNRLVSGAHPQYVLSSTNLTLSSNVSAHIASASVHFTSGSLSGAYVLSSTNSSLSSLVSNLQTSTASISSVVNSHLASASVHFTSGSLSAAYVLSSTNNSLSSLVNEIATSATNLSSLLGQHIGSAVHWELSTLNTNYLNASGDSANAGFYLSSVSATNISATNYYNLPSSTIVWKEAQDIVLLVHNKTANTLFKGTPVTIVSGVGSGDTPSVEPLSSVNTHVPEAYGLSNHVAGLIQEDLAADEIGHIIVEGILEGNGAGGGNLDTDIWAVGDMLYVSSNGQLSNQRPIPPYESHPVGIVLRSQQNNGKILVKIENSPELNDIVGFNLNRNLINGDIITYDLDTSTFINKQTVNVSGLGKFGSVSATSVSSIHLSSTYVSANTILTNKLAVGGSDGYIYNPDGDLYISATNGKVKFNTGFEVTGTISGTSISATTYLNLPSGTAIWNANQLQGKNVATTNPANGDALVWNTSQSRWEPSSISTGGGSVTNNPGGSNGDIQFKNGASFSGVASVNYDSVTDKLNVTNFSAVNLTATNFTNAKLDDHIASASVHFTSGSLSGYYAGSAWTDSRYVLSSVNNALSSQVNNLQASTASISSVVNSHINDSSIHFTSGSLSGYYAGSAWTDGRYVLTSINNALSGQVNDLQASTASISSVVNSHINDSSIHFTSGSLSGYYAGSAWADSRYVLTSINSALSSQVNNLQASTASISSVVNSHINDSSIHFTSGSLSGYYAGSAWADSRYVLSSTNLALSSQVNNLQASTASISSVVNSHINDATIHFTSGSLSGYYAGSAWTDNRYVLSSTNLALSTLVTNIEASTIGISSTVNFLGNSVVVPHIADSTIHFTSGSLSGYYAGSAWTDSRYVLSSTNNALSSQVNNLQASTASISSVVNGHIGSAVHWELSTLNANYINASGDSSNNGFYFSSLSSTRVSATNYINLPSGSEIWNAAQIGTIPIGSTVQNPEAYHVIYYDSGEFSWGTKSVKSLIDLGANFGLKDLVDVRSSSVDPVSSVILDGDPLVWDSNTSSWGSRSLGNFAGNIAPELNPYFVSAGGGTYLNSNYRVSSLRAASISGTTVSATTYQNLPVPSFSSLLDVDVSSNNLPKHGDMIYYASSFDGENIVNKWVTLESDVNGLNSVLKLIDDGIGGVYPTWDVNRLINLEDVFIPNGNFNANETIVYSSVEVSPGTFQFKFIPATLISDAITTIYPARNGTQSGDYLERPNGGTLELTVSSHDDSIIPSGVDINTEEAQQLILDLTVNASAISLSGLGDTNITSAIQGDSLVWDGSYWVPSAVVGGGSPGASYLSALLDVDTSAYSPEGKTLHGSLLWFDLQNYEPSGKWVDLPPDTNSSGYVLRLIDIAGSATPNWEPFALSALSDTQITNPSNDHVLTWSATAGKWVSKAAPGSTGGISNGFAVIQDESANPINATGEDIVRFVSRDDAIVISVDSVASPQEVNFEVDEAGIVHNDLFGLTTGNPHTQYATLSGAVFTGEVRAPSVSATSGIFTNLSATTLSATNYLNIPSGTAIWNASSLLGYNISYTVVTPNDTLPAEGYLLTYTDFGLGGFGVPKAWRPYDSAVFAGLNVFNANKIQSVNVSSTTPTTGDVLTYDGAGWKPSAPAGGSLGLSLLVSNNLIGF